MKIIKKMEMTVLKWFDCAFNILMLKALI